MKKCATILLLISWPIGLIHNFWLGKPEQIIYPFPLYSKGIDIQWYVYDVGSILSYLCIMLAAWCYIDYKAYAFKMMFGALILVQITDLINYLICFSQSVEVVMIEGIMLLVAAINILINGYKKI